MFFSEYFQISEKGHSLYDFIDIDLDRDNKLFIDPTLIGLGSDPWSKKARECIDSFFDSLFQGFKTDDVRDLLSHAHEQNATKLGYGHTGVNGKGKTPDGLDYSMGNLKRLVQEIPSISQCEDLPVLVEGIAVSCIIKVPKVADKNGESCISILEKNATGFLVSSGAYIPS